MCQKKSNKTYTERVLTGTHFLSLCKATKMCSKPTNHTHSLKIITVLEILKSEIMRILMVIKCEIQFHHISDEYTNMLYIIIATVASYIRNK